VRFGGGRLGVRLCAKMVEIVAEIERHFAEHPGLHGRDQFRHLLDAPKAHEKASEILQYATHLKMARIVELALRLPEVDVNYLGLPLNWSPLMNAVINDEARCLKLLLGDPRTKFAIAWCHWSSGKTRDIVEFALHKERLISLQWLIALGVVDRCPPDPMHPALHWAKLNPSAQLMRDYLKRPIKVRHEIRLWLGIPEACAANYFALTLLFTDGFMEFRTISYRDVTDSRRFFVIASRLPLELQMVLAWRTTGDRTRSTVLTKDFEPAIVARTT